MAGQSNALTRLGEIGEAASELAAALRLTPEAEAGRADSENARVFLASLSGVAAQTVEFGPPAPIQARRNELGLWVVPVDLNSQRSEWILDTGASLSTVTESEARRASSLPEVVKKSFNLWPDSRRRLVPQLFEFKSHN